MVARSGLVVVLAFAAGGCSSGPTRPGAYPRWEGAVGMSALRAPRGAESVAELSAEGSDNIEDLIETLVAQARNAGGNFITIDTIRPRVEWQNRPYTQNYNCGAFRFPATCTRTYYQSEEVPIISLRGRAYRLAAGAPR